MKGKFMKRVLFCVFSFLFIYTVFHSIMFYRTGTEPLTLHAMVFGACSVEVILSMIKKIKEVDKDARSNKHNSDIWFNEYSSSTGECNSGASEECVSSGQNTNQYSSSSNKSDTY